MPQQKKKMKILPNFSRIQKKFLKVSSLSGKVDIRKNINRISFVPFHRERQIQKLYRDVHR